MGDIVKYECHVAPNNFNSCKGFIEGGYVDSTHVAGIKSVMR